MMWVTVSGQTADNVTVIDLCVSEYNRRVYNGASKMCFPVRGVINSGSVKGTASYRLVLMNPACSAGLNCEAL